MKILLLSVLVVAMIGLLVPSAFALEDNGDFYLIFNSPNSHSDFFTKIINDVNQSYVLQQDIPIKFEKCGMANAFWNSGLKQITICEEYVSQTQKIFEKKFQNTSDMQKLWTNLAVSFVIYHEIGHSLVDEFNLPVIGREENFADSFAAHEMIETFGASSLIPPISRYFETSSSYHFFGISFLGFSDGMYADSHNLNEQRGYDLLCLAYGGMLTDEYFR